MKKVASRASWAMYSVAYSVDRGQSTAISLRNTSPR